MKKILILILVLSLFGCSESYQKSPEELVDYVLNKGLSESFQAYKNVTAFRGDLIKRMDKRLKVFKPALSKEGLTFFKDNETHWYGINAVIDHQISFELLDYEISLIEEDEDELSYDFIAEVQFAFLDGSTVKHEQKGSLLLSRQMGHWEVDQLLYDNNIFQDLY